MTSQFPMHDPRRAPANGRDAMSDVPAAIQPPRPANRPPRQMRLRGAEFVIGQASAASPPPAMLPAARGIEIVENDPASSGRERTISSIKLLGAYTAERRKAFPVGRASFTNRRIVLHKFDQLRFFMVGPLLSLVPPIHRWITAAEMYQFAFTDLARVTDASPKSHARIRLELLDGTWFELQLSKWGKGKLVKNAAVALDRVLQRYADMRLEQVSATEWRVLRTEEPNSLPMGIIEPVGTYAPQEPELPVAVAEVIYENDGM